METVQQTLSALVSRPDVTGAAFISEEGLLVASRLPETADSEAIAALGASLLRDAAQLASAVGRPAPDRMVCDTEAGMLVLGRLGAGAGAGAALVVLASPGADVGLLLFHLRQQQAALAALL